MEGTFIKQSTETIVTTTTVTSTSTRFANPSGEAITNLVDFELLPDYITACDQPANVAVSKWTEWSM